MTGHPNGTYIPEATYVTATAWRVSYDQETYLPGYSKPRDQISPTVTLNITRSGAAGSIERHPEHDGRQFPSPQAADQYALDHGLIAVYRTPTSQPGITVAHDGEIYAFGVASSWKATRNPSTNCLTLAHADGHTVAAGHQDLDGLIRSHAFLIVREMEARGLLGQQAANT